MISFEELHLQNHKITELSNVFLYLIRDRSMCDTDIACDVFFTYVEKVKEHLEIVEKQMYKKLLGSPDQTIRNKADRFKSGSSEIKKIFTSYMNKWSSRHKRELMIKEHEQFIKETEEMFAMILELILRETEHLYPLVREVVKNERLAA